MLTKSIIDIDTLKGSFFSGLKETTLKAYQQDMADFNSRYPEIELLQETIENARG